MHMFYMILEHLLQIQYCTMPMVPDFIHIINTDSYQIKKAISILVIEHVIEYIIRESTNFRAVNLIPMADTSL